MGCVKRFSADNDAVTKCTMRRADQARKFNSLLQVCTWPWQILKSESRKSNVVTVLENEFVNPFDIALDRAMLINLSSGSEMETSTKLVPATRQHYYSKIISSRTTSIIIQNIFSSHF